MGLRQNPVQWFCLPEPNPSCSLLHQVKLMMVLSITLLSVCFYILELNTLCLNEHH